MERSEPSLVPQWLRSNGGVNGGGGLSHQFASSQADGPLLALPKRNRPFNSVSNSDFPHSSFLDQSSSTNSRRSSSSNGSSKHEKNPYSRAYSNCNRNQRSKDRERLDIADTWDPEYSDPLTNIIAGRIEKDNLRRSQSMISRKPSEFSQRRVSTDLRNGIHNFNGNGNGIGSPGSGTSDIRKVSFEKDFPLLGSDERPATPDIVRVSSPVLSKGVQGLSIGTSQLVGSEGWTSALAEVPIGVGSNSSSTSAAPQTPPHAATNAATGSAASGSSSANGLNMAETLVLPPARSPNALQQSLQAHRFEELPLMGSKRLIPLTTSTSKTLVLNPSDTLKPKTASRSSEAVAGHKNGVQQMSSFQLGSQSVKPGPRSSSMGKLMLLKPGRENGVSPALKDVPSQTSSVTGVVANGLPTGGPAGTSALFKNPNNIKLSTNERKTSGYSLNAVPVVDKRLSQAQLQSRNDFFNLVRKKSMSSTSSAAVDSGVENSDELKEMSSSQVGPTENGSEVKCNGESFADCTESDLGDNAFISPDEEEAAFLRSMGWVENDGDDEGLTEEEIKAFCQRYIEQRPASRLSQILQSKIMTLSNSQASCSAGASSELSTP